MGAIFRDAVVFLKHKSSPMILFDFQTDNTSWFEISSVQKAVILNDGCKDSLYVSHMLFVAAILGPTVVFLKHKSSPMILYDIQRDSAPWFEVSNIEPLS